MKKTFLATIVALVVLVLLAVNVSATSEMGDFTNLFTVTVDGADVDGDTISGIEAGDKIPVKVVFTADGNYFSEEEIANDVRMKVWIDGYRSEIKDSTGRFELVNGSTYSRKFSLTVPSDIDPTEDYTLLVRLYDKTMSDEEEFSFKLQRDSHELQILSVETENTITPGSTIALDVVLKNRGMHELEDVFVTASIPDLEVYRTVYFQDIDSQDECEYGNGDECDGNREDSVERRIYLSIPSNAKAGVYSLEVEAYNDDSLDIVKKTVVILSEEAEEGTEEVEATEEVVEGEGISGSAILLTVILAIIFIVLLIVLIVLLTRKPATLEAEGEETSYY